MSTTTTPTTMPQHGEAQTAPVSPAQLYGYLAEFDSPAQILHAAEKTRQHGYRWFDCCTPFPVHGLDKAMGVKPTILPIIVFFAGLTGTLLGVILQWFTNGMGLEFWAVVPVRGYEFLISGKPLASVPSWIPVVFELTILLAALTAFGAMLLLNRLPLWYHPLLKSNTFHRVTNDRFFLVIEAKDPRFSRVRTMDFIRSLEPMSIEEVEQ